MGKEEKYNAILIILSLLLVLSFLFTRNVLIFIVLILLAIVAILFKKWIKRSIL